MSKSAVYPQFFDPHRLGAGLKEVSSDLLRVESRDLVGRWFHAAEEVDLFIWTDEKKKIVKQQLTFLGQVVEWNVVEGTKTGVIIEDEARASKDVGMNAAETIHFDEIAQPLPLGLAMELIRHATALNPDEQKQVNLNFFKGQRFSKLGPGDFSERYSGDGGAIATRASFVQRFFALVRRFFRGKG
jgi:hypothetical protein